MQSTRNKIIKAICNNHYRVINNRFLVKIRLSQNSKVVPMLLCSKQDIKNHFRAALAKAYKFAAKVDKNSDSNIYWNKNKIIAMAIHRLFVGTDFALVDGYLMDNGYLVIVPSQIHNNLKNHKGILDTKYIANSITDKMFGNMIYATSAHKANWNKNIKNILVHINKGCQYDPFNDDTIDNTVQYDSHCMRAINAIKHMVSSGIEYQFFNHLLSHDIYADNGLYKFKGTLSAISSNTQMLGHELYTQSDVNQIAMISILKFGLVQFLYHAKSFGKKPANVHVYNGWKSNEKDKRVVVNHDHFVQELVKVNNPSLVYLNSDPIKRDITKLSLNIPGKSNNESEGITNILDDDDIMSSNMDLEPDKNLVTKYRDKGHNGRSIQGYKYRHSDEINGIVLSNFKISINDINVNDCPHNRCLYNEYQLNSNFYLTVVRPITAFELEQDRCNAPDIVLPNILYVMYPNGFTLSNYKINSYKMIGFGNGTVLEMRNVIDNNGNKHKKAIIAVNIDNGRVNVSTNDCVNGYTEYDLHDFNSNLYDSFGGVNKAGLERHLKEIKNNKKFLNYVLK